MTSKTDSAHQRHRPRPQHTASESSSGDVSAAAPINAAAAAAAASSAASAAIVHASQSRGAAASPAHICSNTESCPLIAEWRAASDDRARDEIQLSDELLVCSACRSVMYCSRDCQAKHWHAGHKEACPKLRAEWDAKHSPTAAPVAAASSPTGVSARSPHARRNYAINLECAIGPRGLIIMLLLLYLCYRLQLHEWLRGKPPNVSSIHGSSPEHNPLP